MPVQGGYMGVQGGYVAVGGGYMHGVGSREKAGYMTSLYSLIH